MKYPFRDFCRHLEKWFEVKDLKKVRPIPGSSNEIDLSGLSAIQAKQLRIAHMLASEGCPHEEIEYRVVRFYLMTAYLNDHSSEFGRLGFFILDDEGTKSVAPAKLLRAIHETFRGEVPVGIHATPPDVVAKLANSYPAQWKMSEADSN